MTGNPLDIVLTGGTGFIGGHLRTHLAFAGHNVVEVRRQQVLRDGQEIPHGGDAAALAAALDGLQSPVLVHLATHFVSRHATADLAPMIAANITFSSILYDAFFRAGGRHVVVAGSAWQFDAQGGVAPANLYAAQKIAALALLDHYLTAFSGKATQLVLFDTYGPGDTRTKLLPSLRNAVQDGTPFSASVGAQPINLTHVDDVCGAISQAIANTILREDEGRLDEAVKSNEEMSVAALLHLITTEIVPQMKLTHDASKAITAPRALNTSIPTVANWVPNISLRDGLMAYFKRELV